MPDAPDQAPSLQRGLRPNAMFGMMFFIACGGPDGLEEVVVKAGPGLAIVGLFVMAFVWAIPNALIIGGACVTEEIAPGFRVSRASY